MNDLVCIDSHIVVWGVKEQANEEQQDMIPKTKAFLRWLDEQNKRILIPAPVIAEILSPVPPANHPLILNLINKRFIVGTFDALASQQCAKMIYEKDPEIDKYIKEGKIPKRKWKYDYMIASIAVVNEAECIYSEDPDVHKFWDGYIDVRNIPSIREQGNFFDS
jgi:predicted nucleic acid-binding protein